MGGAVAMRGVRRGEDEGEVIGERVKTGVISNRTCESEPSKDKAGGAVGSATAAMAGSPGEAGGLLAGEVIRLLSACKLGVERDLWPTVPVVRYGPVEAGIVPVVAVRLRPAGPGWEESMSWSLSDKSWVPVRVTARGWSLLPTQAGECRYWTY